MSQDTAVLIFTTALEMGLLVLFFLWRGEIDERKAAKLKTQFCPECGRRVVAIFDHANENYILTCKTIAKNSDWWNLRDDAPKPWLDQGNHFLMTVKKRGIQPLFSPHKYFVVLKHHYCVYCGRDIRGIKGNCEGCNAPKGAK